MAINWTYCGDYFIMCTYSKSFCYTPKTNTVVYVSYMYVCVCLIMSDSLQLFGLQPARLLCPWDFQAVKLKWVAFSSSRGSSLLRDQTFVSCIAGWFFYLRAICENHVNYISIKKIKKKLPRSFEGPILFLSQKGKGILFSGRMLSSYLFLTSQPHDLVTTFVISLVIGFLNSLLLE